MRAATIGALLLLLGRVAAANPAPYLPPQCYAVTQDGTDGRTHNGCSACHQTPREPNYTDDAAAQVTLTFAAAVTENHWDNIRRPPPPARIATDALLQWVRRSNYFDERGQLRLAQAPAAWDADGNGRFDGYLADCWFAPDAAGFDRAPDGKTTGWRAYASVPFPGFWPTNGLAGDAYIRLPAAYRETGALYFINLAITEAMIRRVDVPIPPADERALGVDLDGNGALGTATKVAFVWPRRTLAWVGAAHALDAPVAGLYPRGTELLHSLRYLDVTDGQVRPAARMKELRYLRKVRGSTYAELAMAADAEAREKERKPDRLKHVQADAERGAGTGTGWVLQGFIEDAGGALRPQTVEESTACVGCHGGVGATTDATFSFARKVAWGAAPAPLSELQPGEYARWLSEVGGGDDYRANDELRARFFNRQGRLRRDAAARLRTDVRSLLWPSPGRALALDRAYLAIVRAQSFVLGRDTVVGAPPRVHAWRPQNASTGLKLR